MSALVLLLGLTTPAAAAPPPPAVLTLLEDDAAGLLKLLTNPTGDPGEGHVETDVVFAGTRAIRIVPMQRFSPRIGGWGHRIAEKPGPGEYRYLRFAWKADGCNGIMLQLHTTDWKIRYTAGVDRHNWGTKFVGERPPTEWAVHTVDLFKDFGADTITGIALTAFEGKAAYFDHIYLGRSIDDLDRIDATGPAGKLPPGGLAAAWAELGGSDAAAAYRAFWRLVRSPDVAAPFLTRSLGVPSDAELKQIRGWLRDLDDDSAKVRDAAEDRLRERLEIATPLIEAERKASPSAEVRRRARRLLEGRVAAEASRGRVEKAVRALEYMNTPASRATLRRLAGGPAGAHLTLTAKAALERMGDGR